MAKNGLRPPGRRPMRVPFASRLILRGTDRACPSHGASSPRGSMASPCSVWRPPSCGWQAPIPEPMAIVSITYFTAATVLLGDSATASVIRWLRAPRAAEGEAAPAESAGVVARAWRYGVTIAASVFRGGGENASAESVEARERAWTTDARRVRPREAPPRLRVRFKLP